ncbi:MAG: hypothetical protein HYY17_09815 [Planctomycetes bacterium]|nr:hypothetical protein [Planctomycetota bacterium]
MIRLALAWAALVCPQDPDRSAPEKTFEGFTAFWEELSPEKWFFDLLGTLDDLGKFSRTDEFSARRDKDRGEFLKWMEDSKMLSSRYEIAKRSEGKEGRIVLDSVQKVRRKKRDFEKNKIEEVDQELPHRHVFRRVGETWLVEEVYKPCSACDGRGACGTCKGTGTAHDRACFACEGKKSCKYCGGEKLKKEELAKGGLELVVPDTETKYSTDLSSPKAAAQTLLDLSLRTAVEYSVRIRGFIERILKRFRLFVVPELVKKIEDELARETEAGKKRFREDRPRIDSVEEKGDRALVVIVTIGNWGRLIRSKEGENDRQEHRARHVLRKVGDRWLADAEQYPCWNCKGKGDCSACGGSGKTSDRECWGCKGTKKCSQCKGEGWADR